MKLPPGRESIPETGAEIGPDFKRVVKAASRL
jgi:hypothetical protein